MHSASRSPPSVAVVGAGAAGLAAAWLLSRGSYSVTLFDIEPRAGGHAHTIDVQLPGYDAASLPLDVGFLVYNTTTYPDLVSLFEMLGVEQDNSSMSFAASVTLQNGNLFEWGSDSLATLFANRANLYTTSMYAMLYDMRRFNYAVHHFVHRLDSDPQFSQRDISLAQFLEAGSYSSVFIRCYLIPMVSAVWSASFNSALQFPVRSLFHFFVNHGLAQVFARPQWRTPTKRSRDYVEKLLHQFRNNGGIVMLDSPVTAVQRVHDGVILHADDDFQPTKFDHVIFATHAPTTLEILGEQATEEERAILTKFRYEENKAFVHTDEKLMPVNRAVWSAWNFMGRTYPSSQSPDATQIEHAKSSKTPTNPDDIPVCVTYWLNKLQNLHKTPFPVPDLFLTLNPTTPVDPEKKLAEITFAHPQFTEAAVSAQPQLQKIQGLNRTWFCGAYARYGFHEDAMTTGFDVAERLSGFTNIRPWRQKHALAINDHTRLYEVPYTATTHVLALLGTLLVLGAVVYRLQLGLGKIAKRMSDSDPVVVVAAGDGRLHRFGPPRIRKRSRSSGSLGRSDDMCSSASLTEPQTARVTVKSARMLVRIAESLRRCYELAPTAAAAFAAGELDAPTPHDLTVALQAMFIADGLDVDPSKARRGRAKFAESLLSNILGGVRKVSSLSTDTAIPELTTCISNVVYPSWWLQSSIEEDNYNPTDGTGKLTPSRSLQRSSNILEFLGDLSERTVSLLEADKEAHATIVVRTAERSSFVSCKAELLSVGKQIDIVLLEDFISKRQLQQISSSSLDSDEALYDIVVSPAMLNSFKGCGYKSVDECLVFIRKLSAPTAVVEVGGTVFGSKRGETRPRKAQGSCSLFCGDSGFMIWNTSDFLSIAGKSRYELQSLAYMDNEEAAVDVSDVIERVYGRLAPGKLSGEETRKVMAQMCLWQAALGVKYLRRIVFRFKLT